MSAEPLEPLHPSHIHLAGWNYNEDTERRILAHLYEPQHEEDLLKVWIEFVSSIFFAFVMIYAYWNNNKIPSNE